MTRRLYLVNGPNLNLLERRDATLYGGVSLLEVVSRVETVANEFSAETVFFQSNHEGELVDYIQEVATSAGKRDGMVINPAAFSHTSIAILDALELVPCPVIEVHLSNLNKRESFRRESLTARGCQGIICGLGVLGYQLAAQAALSDALDS